MIVDAKPLPGVEITEVEYYCECNIEVVMKNKVPESFKYARKDWALEKKRTLLYEEQIEKKALSDVWEKEIYKSWTPEGVAFSQECYIKGKLINAKYYKPDGKIGAEVNDGEGTIREWYDDGVVAMRVPVLNGLLNGIMKEYSGEGKIISETNFKDGEENNFYLQH